MKSKLFIIIYLIFTKVFVFSQFTINGHNNGWLLVNSNNGEVFTNMVNLRFEILGKKAFDYKNWSVTGRVISPIINNENKEFPVSKLKFRFTNHQFYTYFSKTNSIINPSVNELGIIQNVISMDLGPKFFIHNSLLSLQNPEDEYGLLLNYDILIEGGNYLSSLKSWENYPIRFEFSLLDESGRVINKITFPIDMQIRPNGNYQEVPELSIQIKNNAQNAELIFSSVDDYKNGVTKVYENALNVSANTGYEITVKSLSEQLRSNSNTMNADLVKIQLKDTKTNIFFNPETLSIIPKRIANGTASSQVNYSIIYSVLPNLLINSLKMGHYSTSLIYSISPL